MRRLFGGGVYYILSLKCGVYSSKYGNPCSHHALKLDEAYSIWEGVSKILLTKKVVSITYSLFFHLY